MRLAGSAAAGVGAILAGLLTFGVAARAVEPVVLTLKDHRFTPDAVQVPAGQRLRIEVQNLDATPEEFESTDFRAEKIIVPGGKIIVQVAPLRPGTYNFYGEYHKDQARGTLTAVAGPESAGAD